MINKTSGYDPETGICWQFRNKGDRNRRCKCPACSRRYGERTLAWFGRCRSGSRWFWTAHDFTRSTQGNDYQDISEYGWADTEDAAMAAAMTAVRAFKEPGSLMVATLVHGQAIDKLKELNEAKRRARPAPDTSDASAVEYLYARGNKFQILKKTKQRIYYSRKPLPLEEQADGGVHDPTDYGTAFIDRQKIEQEGEIWSHKFAGWWEADCRLYLKPPAPRADTEALPDLTRLKAEMAAAHPDRGGSSTAFVEARSRYVAARRASRKELHG
jgi:hypothetical protein